MTLVNRAESLFSHEVRDHIRCTNKERLNVAQFCMVAAEMSAHIDMSGGRFVGRMKAHGDGATIITIQIGRGGVTKT